MKIRFLSFLMTISLLFTMISGSFGVMVMASETPKITVDSVSAKNGDTVKVPVRISGNPGIWGMDLVLSYDRNILTLIGVTNGNVFSDAEWTKGNIESDEYIQQSENISISRLQHELMIRIENEFADAGIKADFEAAELFCNADLIERALLNFVSNAVKYGEKDKEIILTGKNEKDRYVFSVSNYGAEINGEEQRKIWEAFYKNDKSRKRGGGHGLGLSIVSRIAKSHGGDVDLKSEEGINTFIMWIPLT